LDFPRIVYDRLNRRYGEIHDWCRFFVHQLTLLNRNGTVEFQGFLLNMFELFERFVLCVFRKAADSRFGIHLENAPFPLDIDRKVGIHPDLVIRGQSFIAVGDAKYKITRDQQGRHPDLYQVVAYATAVRLDQRSKPPSSSFGVPGNRTHSRT
jgi:5-methylcytosine-specific restriction endonuclease McrBC regulatory subunit McrC